MSNNGGLIALSLRKEEETRALLAKMNDEMEHTDTDNTTFSVSCRTVAPLIEQHQKGDLRIECNCVFGDHTQLHSILKKKLVDKK